VNIFKSDVARLDVVVVAVVAAAADVAAVAAAVCTNAMYLKAAHSQVCQVK